MDFRHEGQNGERCYRELKHLSFVHVPKIKWEMTTKVLVFLCFFNSKTCYACLKEKVSVRISRSDFVIYGKLSVSVLALKLRLTPKNAATPGNFKATVFIVLWRDKFTKKKCVSGLANNESHGIFVVVIVARC